MPPSPPLCSPLPNAGFLLAEGPDAKPFLNAQLSQRIEHATATRAPLAAWHDPQGRVQALVRLVDLPAGMLLLTPADRVDPLLDRLRRFVLRSKVQLANVSAHWASIALLGGETAALTGVTVTVGSQRDAALQADDLIWIRAGEGLVYAAGARGRLAEVARSLPAVASERAALAEIRLGLPELSTATEGRYLPQMLNLDRLGALAADKGCYPGQEVITRVQHRGTVKRRMQRFVGALSEPPAPGAEVADESGRGTGEVIRSARAEAGIELLAVVPIGGISDLRLAAAPAVPLTRAPLPYESA